MWGVYENVDCRVEGRISELKDISVETPPNWKAKRKKTENKQTKNRMSKSHGTTGKGVRNR